jgi:hypothetical protein
MNRRTFCTLPLAAAVPLAAQTGSSDADPGAPKAAIERWKDLRFGMFIHWGPVSIVGMPNGSLRLIRRNPLRRRSNPFSDRWLPR